MSEGLRLLGSIIETGSSAILLRTDRERFTTEEQVAYDFVSDFYRQYREMPQPDTVRAEIGVVLPVPNQSLEWYVNQVEDRYVFNAMRDSYAAMREPMRVRDVAAMRELANEMNAVAGTRRERGQSVMGIGQALGLVTARLRSTMGQGGITGIETPWPSYDMITGGYQNADLITIVGRPGVAKTYNILSQAMAAHDAGHSAVVVTTEMGIEQLARRYAALKIGVNPTLLKTNMISTYTMRRIESLGVELLEDERFRIFSVGMGAKVSAIEALLQEYGPNICYVDGTYLLHPSVKGQMKRIERVGEVFDELKGLSISADIPIVNTMQFNRQAGKGGQDGSLENIGFTDAVGQHSSIVIALKMGPTENPFESRTMNFMKGREGEIGDVHMHFKFAPVNMSELEPEHVAGGPEAVAAAGDADVDWMA